MNLTATTHTLELVTSTASTIAWTMDGVIIDKSGASTAYTPISGAGSVASATDTTIASAPAGANISHTITGLSVANTGTTANTVAVQKDVAGTEYPIYSAVLQAGERMIYRSDAGWRTFTAAGALKSDPAQSGSGVTLPILAVGTATEAAGVWYSHHKDTGTPGAWAPGTPGLAGRTTNGTTTTDNGCLKFPNATSGANYLSAFTITTAVTGLTRLHDVLWVNSGLVVTTTTAQTINSLAFPARCTDGTANGAGVMVGILVTTATTNAAAVTNTTMVYTNQDGVGTRTATMASFPATAVIGTIVWFQLAAGDSGVRSIQTCTLGTSYAAGAISLIAAVPIADVATTTASVAASAPIDPAKGIRLYDGACLLMAANQSATTAATRVGSATITTK